MALQDSEIHHSKTQIRLNDPSAPLSTPTLYTTPMFYTTDGPGLSIDSSSDRNPFPDSAKTSHPADAEQGGWAGFAVLVILMAAGFAGLTFGSVKLAEGAILSQQGIVGPVLAR
ncbi:hypothetical protein [Thermoleptolyngbya sp.]